jgi:hypothetical protein
MEHWQKNGRGGRTGPAVSPQTIALTSHDPKPPGQQGPTALNIAACSFGNLIMADLSVARPTRYDPCRPRGGAWSLYRWGLPVAVFGIWSWNATYAGIM